MKIDLNCDVGEGVENEHLLMPFISSCSIACGGHFGNEKTIYQTLESALHYNVKVGAHPSFPDKENFGRQLLEISDANLKQSLQQQLDLFLNVLTNFKVKLHHIKPHGALYNAIAKDEKLATLFLDALKFHLQNCFLYVPFDSVIASLAIENGIKIRYEVFADRNYNDDYSLVSRKLIDALLTDKKSVLNHVLNIAKKGKVKTLKGKDLPIQADTFCVHGDTDNAIEIVKYLAKELPKCGIEIE
ncbi:MAG: 5-oxoprolinase subunit PxpA [Flavobacteriaceae bacterium]|nr:5-oxoprolinase subunit PxpA [Flavobacteriaceae bacterium]